jgi:hypothetical protein
LGIGSCGLHFLADFFVDLEKLCNASVYADTLPLVEITLCIPRTDAFAMTRPVGCSAGMHAIGWLDLPDNPVEDVRDHVDPGREVNKERRRKQRTYSLMAISMRSWLTPPEGVTGLRPNMDIWTDWKRLKRLGRENTYAHVTIHDISRKGRHKKKPRSFCSNL